MATIMEYFDAITQLPHCSREAEALRDYLVTFGRERGYRVEVDGADNVLVYRGKPTLCLQAHYDMVCVGEAPDIETYMEDGWLKAKDSSLGADNGIAIAMMLALMDEGKDLEYLFTADEEIGLIGASALDFPLYSNQMLNLDFEDEAEVCIGCAGGADIVALGESERVEGEGQCYEISVQGLPGGHSGVDIDKDIPSAIKLLGTYLYDNKITQLVSFCGGERRNSIPANATAIIRSRTKPKELGGVKVRALNGEPKTLEFGTKLIELIARFKHGEREHNVQMGIPESSINLAIIVADSHGKIEIETSARGMDEESLEDVVQDTVSLFDRYTLQSRVDDKYPSWKPEINAFTKLVSTYVEAQFGSCNTMAIHAGLECGLLKQKYPHIQFASMGPKIKYPHSTRERVDIASAERTFAVLRQIVEASV